MQRRRLRFLVLVLGVAACGDPTGVEEEVVESPCTVRPAIALGELQEGRLDSGDCLRPDGTYADEWLFTIDRDLTAIIELSSFTFDTFLEVYDSVGTLVALNDDAGYTFNSRVVPALRAGTYSVVVSSFFSGALGDYRLRVTEGPDCSPLGTLELGSTVDGSIAGGDCLPEFGGLQDNWSFVANTAQRVRIELTTENFSGFVLLRDPQTRVVGGSYPLVEGSARFDIDVSPGAYLVSAVSSDSTVSGSYRLLVEVAPPCAPGTALEPGVVVDDEISTVDCLLDGWVPADSFGLQVVGDDPIDISLTSAEIDPWLLIRDPSGAEVAAVWDSRGRGEARYQGVLDPGVYSVFVTTYDGTMGAYHLTFDEITCDDPTPIQVGDSIDSELDVDDCWRANGSSQERWTFELASETSIRIDLTSDDFDPYLVLADADGAQIAVNDDGGEGVAARIQSTLAPGVYVISATAVSPAQLGAYRLSVTAPPPP